MKATVIGTTFWLILMPALASEWSSKITEYDDALDRALNYASINDRFRPPGRRRIRGYLEVTDVLHTPVLLKYVKELRTAQPGKPVQLNYLFHAIINPNIKRLRKRLICTANITEFLVNKKFYYILPYRKNLKCREQVLAHKGNASLIAIDKDTEHANKSHAAETKTSIKPTKTTTPKIPGKISTKKSSKLITTPKKISISPTTIPTTTKKPRTTTMVTTPRTTKKLLSAGKNSDFSKQKTQLQSLSRGMSNRRNSAPKMKNITKEKMENGLVQNLNFNKFQEQPKMKPLLSSSLTQSQPGGGKMDNGLVRNLKLNKFQEHPKMKHPLSSSLTQSQPGGGKMESGVLRNLILNKFQEKPKMKHSPSSSLTQSQHEGENGKPEPDDKVSHKVAEYKLKEATINVYMDRDTAKPWLPGPNKDVLKNAVVNIRIDSSDKNK